MDAAMQQSSQLNCSRRRPKPRSTGTSSVTNALLLSLAASALPTTLAQRCIPLSGSTLCPAFSNASISTDNSLTDPYPFLSFVSDAASFDEQFSQYIETDYVREKYQQLIGCDDLNLKNTSNVYARYTASFLCNVMVQKSIQACGLSTSDSQPLCADTCAQFAISEQEIAASPGLCGKSGPDAMTQIRADFTDCYLPTNSLSGDGCIEGSDNEPDNCGFNANLKGLCSFCSASSPNSTDWCCVTSDAENRCANVQLPITTSMAPIFTHTPSSTAEPSSSATTSPSSEGLTGGQIAGIVIGAIVGALLILGLIIFGCIALRRRSRSSDASSSVFNQPAPARQGPVRPAMGYHTDGHAEPVGRIARMAALENTSSSSGRDRSSYHSGAYDTPRSRHSVGPMGGALPKRDGSLSSHSALGMGDYPMSPTSGSGNDTFTTTSPTNGMTSGQSEQLQSFKDYYSQDEIHPNDAVSVLWAYQPRANDEWELERGDMLKIVGIWDDGWATGVRLTERCEEWEARRQWQRDSGVSNASEKQTTPVAHDGEIKAFPLVCVCLPQHWRKTIEGDTTDPGSPSNGDGPPPPPSSP